MAKRRVLRVHTNSSPRMIPPRTAFGRRFEKWLRTQRIGGRPIVSMADAAQLIGFGVQTVVMWRSGERTPGRISKLLVESYMRGEVTPPGAQK